MDDQNPSASIDPAVAIIVEAYERSGQPFLIVNEHHAIDWHRHVSACILDAAAGVRPLTFGAEALSPEPRIKAPADYPEIRRSVGYEGSRYFQHIWRVAIRHDMVVFGYDPFEDDLSPAELAARGLSNRAPNPRDGRAAETIMAHMAQFPDHGVYLHVGHAHVHEGWREYPEGGFGWLAAHLTRLSGHDPVTVQQLSQEHAEIVSRRGAFDFSRTDCRGAPDDIPVLETGVGVVGCAVERRVNDGGRYVDFVILDGASENGRAPDRPYTCDAWRHDYARR